LRRVVASAPARVDLAGGSLDLWPLGLLVDGAQTVNVALSLRAEACLEATGAPGVELVSDDYGHRYTWSGEGPWGPLRLLERYCLHYKLPGGWRLTTRSGSPPGAGLGGSSALSVAVARALLGAAGREFQEETLVAECRDIEAQELGIPTGVQDFWPAIRGGVLCLRFLPGAVRVERLPVDLAALGERMVVAYTGQSRLSARTNWDLFRRFVDGDSATREALAGVAAAARGMGDALVEGNWDAAGEQLALEMRHRGKLAPGIETPESRTLFEAARGAGALGAKVCGAGGGGCLVFWTRGGYKEAVSRRLEALGARVLDAGPSATGLRLEDER